MFASFIRARILLHVSEFPTISLIGNTLFMSPPPLQHFPHGIWSICWTCVNLCVVFYAVASMSQGWISFVWQKLSKNCVINFVKLIGLGFMDSLSFFTQMRVRIVHRNVANIVQHPYQFVSALKDDNELTVKVRHLHHFFNFVFVQDPSWWKSSSGRKKNPLLNTVLFIWYILTKKRKQWVLFWLVLLVNKEQRFQQQFSQRILLPITIVFVFTFEDNTSSWWRRRWHIVY